MADLQTFPSTDHNHGRCVSQALQRAEEICRRRSERLTPLRRRVLELIWESHRPVGAYDLLETLRREQGRTAPPTVYRSLDFLQQLGLVHRVESLNAFVGCAHAGRPHAAQFLICEECRDLAEVELPSLDRSLQSSLARTGFTPRHTTIEVLGLCPNCSGGGS